MNPFLKANFLLVLAFVSGCIFNLKAQEELPRIFKSYNMTLTASGQNSKSVTKTEQIIEEKGATWLRVFFDNVRLTGNSTLTVTSLQDNASQTFTAKMLRDWNYSSAYFNGNKLKISLNEEGLGDNGVRISKISMGTISDADNKSQCGSQDNRVASNDDAIVRIEPIGCT